MEINIAMKPEFEKILKKPTRSFMVKVVRRQNRPLLAKAWHYHPEFEICYTLKSKGRRYVGNNISDYQENDFVILGSNLPHGFTTTDECEHYVVQFGKEFLGKDFFNAVELARIKELLLRSKRGLLLSGPEVTKIGKKIINLHDKGLSNFEQLLLLLKILDRLSRSANLSPICTEKYSSDISISKLNDIKTVFDYIENNFQKEPSIRGASEAINLTESAFYKFIKRHTNKKFTTILNEYRLDHASKLLVSSNLPIAAISFQSGYSNLSHFNRIFKNTYNMTPKQLRSKYTQNLIYHSTNE